MNTHVGGRWRPDAGGARAEARRRRLPGPTLRADGIYQLYVPLPYLHIVEVDAMAYDAKQTRVASLRWGDNGGARDVGGDV